MGKKNKAGTSLGRSLIKERFGNPRGEKLIADKSMLHTTAVQDGYDWGRLNLQSVTEESSFQEFLSTAELTGAEFQAEKLDIKFVNPSCNFGLLTNDEMTKAKHLHEKNKDQVKIPRRPPWDITMSREELDANEKAYFLQWRRSLMQLQEDEGVLLTPYEKNLEFWRQLWRVVERSDVIVQIVDARNPLLFFCQDLEKYSKEVSPNKTSLVLINKADFLTDDQRQFWADYFTLHNHHVVFYSATLPMATKTKDAVDERETSEVSEDDKLHLNELQKCVNDLENEVEKTAKQLDTITKSIQCGKEYVVLNFKDILTREQLIDLFRTAHEGIKVNENITTIGLIGYPNVGKSSTINSLLLAKKVSVSATPGKTKHFQTIFLDKDILLCDCPGLVMPTFVYTKAEMIISGILPIDQMRDHVPPINLVLNIIPKHVFEDMYGIILPEPTEGEDPNRYLTSEQLLNAYAYNRGFMTANGQPDNARAARYVLKDFINGELLFCHAPPNIIQSEYHKWPERKKASNLEKMVPPRMLRAVKPNHATTEDVDETFFSSRSVGVHMKGRSMNYHNLTKKGQEVGEKPWKKLHRHENKNKKEKLRRIYAHLDQH